MPSKKQPATHVALIVQAHAAHWGARIRAQRVANRITSQALADRIGVSQPTVTRLEKGDPRINLAAYLSAFYALGLVDDLAPEPEGGSSSDGAQNRRVRFSKNELGDDLGYF